jgi:membrane protein
MSRLLSFPWKKFFWELYERIFEAELFARSAQVAFYFSFSIFPLLFFLVSLFGLVLDSTSALEREMYSYLGQIMPRSAYNLVQRTLQEIIENSSARKATLGLAITLWSASAGIDGIRSALNAVYGLRESRPWWRTKFQSLYLTLLFILLLALVLTIEFYGWQIFQVLLAFAGFEITSPLVLVSIQWISTLIVMLFAFEILYNIIPDYGRAQWEWINPGSFIAIGLWLLTTSGFRLYLSYFNSYNRTYGSLGAVIILMLWLYISAVVIVFGGSINAVLREIRADRLKLPVIEDEELLEES